MAFIFYINDYQFPAPPQFTVSSRHKLTEINLSTWEEEWKFEGVIACSGISDAKSKWDAIRSELSKENLKSFKFVDDFDNSVVIQRSTTDAGVYIYPELTELSFPSSGADAAWATNLRYSFTLRVVIRPSDAEESDKLYEDVSLKISVNELGYVSITEDGKVRYKDASWTNPAPLPKFYPGRKSFRLKTKSFTWNSDRTRCEYSYSWDEIVLRLPFDDEVIVLPEFSFSMKSDYFKRDINATVAFSVPKSKQTPKVPKVTEDKITLSRTEASIDITPSDITDVPADVASLIHSLSRYLVFPATSFNRVINWSWDAKARKVQVQYSYSLPLMGNILEATYNLSYKKPMQRTSDFSRLSGFPIVYRSGMEPGAFSEQLQIKSRIYKRYNLSVDLPNDWLKVSENESLYPSGFFSRKEQPVYSYSLSRNYKIYTDKFTEFATFINKFYELLGAG